ncbi:TPA: hypothetical protein R3V21_002259 [Salmonella enterica]|nr:hypothetical protein [Salmonella enterica]EBQ8936668.1 hypothetical protein [Salmonella enterica subsp. enterica serovar Rideau]HBM0089673.1 hypothetical protein [Salmonella enterica subsp. enterica serovar Tilburg]HEC5271080.1 hypothetical protein [Salmonella enterica]
MIVPFTFRDHTTGRGCFGQPKVKPIPETLQCTEKWRQVAPVQRFSEGAGVFITDILHCAFGNPQDQLFYR